MIKKNNRSEFEIFVDDLHSFLSHVKFWKNSAATVSQRIFDISVNVTMLTLSILLIISETVDIKNSYDLTSSAAHINPICFHLNGLLKWCFGLIKLNDIEEILAKMKRCHRLCLNYTDSEKEIRRYNLRMLEYKQNVIKFVYIWLILLVYGVNQWCLDPIMKDLYHDLYGQKIINSSFNRHLPYPGLFPWHVDNFSKGEVNVRKATTKLKMYLMHHREISEFVEKLKKVSSYPMFILCLDSTIALCLVSLEASAMKIDSSVECIMKIMNMGIYWIGIALQLFIFTFLASSIEELGLQTADAIYSCNWERSIVEYRGEFTDAHKHVIVEVNQLITFSLMRAQKPIVFMGGKFYILSLQTFKALTGFSLSNAVVLRQLSSEE
ncbi:uncharacterized protein LOC123264296 isoform X3 [Cotesia glomerata]|uniref:uncharacterized protein LOC123264296 isoform X3 n=1 Tax=Cotesia glomerata TaxID=32391 RepID=UPI001D02B9A5|nr:uncharacterized protein LOC123264296 isoform X3 [Cotesia glomerata]